MPDDLAPENPGLPRPLIIGGVVAAVVVGYVLWKRRGSSSTQQPTVTPTDINIFEPKPPPTKEGAEIENEDSDKSVAAKAPGNPCAVLRARYDNALTNYRHLPRTASAATRDKAMEAVKSAQEAYEDCVNHKSDIIQTGTTASKIPVSTTSTAFNNPAIPTPIAHPA